MEHPENDESYKGLVVNAGIEQLRLSIPIAARNLKSVSVP